MFVKEAMQTDVKTVEENQTVREAAEIMNEFRVGSLVVVSEGGGVSGILTERDILVNVVAKGKKSHEIKIKDIMTDSDEIILVQPESTLEEAADLMTQYKIKRLPVVDEGKLVGIITATDLIAHEKILVEKIEQLIDLKRDGKK